MSTLFRSTSIRLLLVGALAALSFQALGKLDSSDALEREWGMPLNRDLSKLSNEGRLDAKKFPWSDTFTESNTPLLLSRWYRTEFAPADRFRTRAPYLDEITKMDRLTRSRVVNEQSAATLFDLARGRPDYPLTKELKKILQSKNAEHLDEWLSFGWAAAATSFAEPNAVTRTVHLPTGHDIDLEIGSTDMKSYVSYYYGVTARDRVKVYKTERLDPATFHIYLTNMIRTDGKSFVIDIDPSAKKDFRPVAGFESDIRVVPNKDRLYKVTTTVDYARRRLPQKQPYGFFNLDTDRVVYEYTLSVDGEGKILRGDWANEKHPDLAWRVKELPPVDREFAVLRDLFKETPFDAGFEQKPASPSLAARFLSALGSRL